MDALGVERVVLTRGESVQWLTGVFLGPLLTPTAAMDSTGRVTVALPERSLSIAAAADERVGYEAKLHSTFRDDQRTAAWNKLVTALPAAPGQRVAGEASCWGPSLTESLGEPVDLEPTMFRLRRRKDPDELRMLARANEANRAMYERAREVVRPGLNELDMYSELCATAVGVLREPLTYFGQDFQAGSRGGPPRDRAMNSGELIILDLGVGFRGYYSDNARTLAVDGHPTPAQQAAQDAVAEALAVVSAEAHPGASCRRLFEQIQTLLDRRSPWVFNHHLGHGVGLAPHEGPHLNPRWDDALEVGDYFTAEPGLYHEELRHGVRLEQNYVVTETGVELKSPWPLELASS